MARRILVLGGGFAGVSAAGELTRLLRRQGRLLEPRRARSASDDRRAASGEAIEVLLVDRNNYSVFQPFLPELLSATIEPTHAVVPLRRLLPHAEVEVGIAERIDIAARTVHLRRPLDGAPFQLAYDALVLAVGGVTNFHVVPGMAEQAVGLRSLGDAFYLRNRALDMLEAARVEGDPERRRRLSSFVIIGGGSTGVEVAAHLHHLLRAAAATFRGAALEPRVTVVHGRDIVLNEFGRRLGAYTTDRLRRTGVELVLGRHAASVDARGVSLDGGGRLKAATVVSTVGNAPNPLLRDLPAEYDDHGWIRADATFGVPGLERVWALGDCATITDPETQKPMPATAQHAVREGPHAARNILAALDGRRPAPFHYGQLGMLVSLGGRSGAGTLLGVRVSGFPAWFAWRSYYLLRMPTLDRRVRVALDWSADLVLPRDTVEMNVRRSSNVAGRTEDATHETGGADETNAAGTQRPDAAGLVVSSVGGGGESGEP